VFQLHYRRRIAVVQILRQTLSDSQADAVRTADFDYVLPQDRIAQQPVEPRDASRLLHLPATGECVHTVFRDLGRFLRAGDALVLNDTRVLAARLRGVFDDTGGHVEALLLRRREPDLWEAMVRPARRARAGRRLRFDEMNCTVNEALGGGFALLRFEAGADPSRAGEVPLPPYIHERPADPERYQTVYARAEGSAAAPTAGLHFTESLLTGLQEQGIGIHFLTLHVGPGTFRPVAVEDPRQHPMHEEWFSLDSETAEALEAARAAEGRIVAVGTTVVRTLEQVAAANPDGRLSAASGWTRLLILPGHRFRAVDMLVTNFHLPRSTLLMLVSAYSGRERILAAYDEAVRLGYRFFSFGDAMLLERGGL
jgi:S-adenosylmethionine:tRNA ribosyltransferase-isomerase